MADNGKPANFADTAEFKAAVEKAAQDAVEKALSAARGAAGTQGAPGDPGWVQQLAMAIATLSHQGTGSKMRAPIPPDVMKARQDARNKMFDRLIAARANGEVPCYRVTSKTLLDNALVQPFWIDSAHTAQPTIIEWPGVPNEVMVPVNEVACEVYSAFEASIGALSGDDYAAVNMTRKQFEEPRQGLVIKTSPGLQPAHATGNENPDDPSLLQGLKLRHDNQPGRYKEVNILGTIARPAQQSI